MILVSACLAWMKCRYDGNCKSIQKIIDLVKNGEAIPVCPELLWWLWVPREKCEKLGERIITETGNDMTTLFYNWAHEVLEIAKIKWCKFAILKSKSPSCGKGLIYDWTFRNRLIKWDWVLTKLLKENNIKVITENEIV